MIDSQMGKVKLGQSLKVIQKVKSNHISISLNETPKVLILNTEHLATALKDTKEWTINEKHLFCNNQSPITFQISMSID